MSRDEVKKNDCDKEEYPLLFANDEEQKQGKLKKRYKRAWSCAREAATLLKRDYKAKKVWVFGSLVDESRFNIWSDIDLAADGIPDSMFYAAVGAVTKLITDFKVDLVDINDCKKKLYEAVKSEGIEI